MGPKDRRILDLILQSYSLCRGHGYHLWLTRCSAAGTRYSGDVKIAKAVLKVIPPAKYSSMPPITTAAIIHFTQSQRNVRLIVFLIDNVGDQQDLVKIAVKIGVLYRHNQFDKKELGMVLVFPAIVNVYTLAAEFNNRKMK